MKNSAEICPAPLFAGYWRGLGLWNFYFIAKLMLYWSGALNFHVFYNLVFAAALLAPLPPLWLHRLRHLVAAPVGVALLYYDSWLPPFSRLLDQPEVLGFSGDYMLELLGRFINWNMLGAGLIALVVYLFLSQWLRITVFVVAALAVLGLSAALDLSASNGVARPAGARQAQAPNMPEAGGEHATGSAATVSGKPVNINTRLTENLQAFYNAEQARKTDFSAPVAGAAPFDVLFLNICSLSWSDLEVSRLEQHPLLQKMDIVFDDFNSATSYSGPAVLRLLRASCGQTPHQALYQPAPDQCYLFENLKQLGFETHTALNHDGQFQRFLDDLTEQGKFPAPVIPENQRRKLSGFDGSPIWGDLDILHQWWDQRQKLGSPSVALLYNSITLHDGNREATTDGGSRLSPYKSRAQQLLDDLDAFMNELERSGRKVAVVLIPEHGASLEGDRMQIAGMREIPTTDITHVPVGIRLIGAGDGQRSATVHVQGPSSYLAVSEVMARLVSQGVFDAEKIDWQALVRDLPETRAVSENAGTVLMSHEQAPYVRMGDRDWLEYQR
ncbi:cellulose biosynthesis protein BcsG [Alcaligenaceae bacterium]|nr:cellulose biosynthesis protein BcsG [Alcaligenaceae bacterium]